MGAETFVQVVVGGGGRVVARLGPDRVFSHGMPVTLTVALDHAVFFDGESERALGSDPRKGAA
jgi:hypothetical protein